MRVRPFDALFRVALSAAVLASCRDAMSPVGVSDDRGERSPGLGGIARLARGLGLGEADGGGTGRSSVDEPAGLVRLRTAFPTAHGVSGLRADVYADEAGARACTRATNFEGRVVEVIRTDAEPQATYTMTAGDGGIAFSARGSNGDEASREALELCAGCHASARQGLFCTWFPGSAGDSGAGDASATDGSK